MRSQHNEHLLSDLIPLFFHSLYRGASRELFTQSHNKLIVRLWESTTKIIEFNRKKMSYVSLFLYIEVLGHQHPHIIEIVTQHLRPMQCQLALQYNGVLTLSFVLTKSEKGTRARRGRQDDRPSLVKYQT